MAPVHLSVHFVVNLCVGARIDFWSALPVRQPLCWLVFGKSQASFRRVKSTPRLSDSRGCPSLLDLIDCVAVSTHTFGAFPVCIQVGRFAVSTLCFLVHDILVVVSLLFGVREIEHCLCEACGPFNLCVVCNCEPPAVDLFAFPDIYTTHSLWLCSSCVFPNPPPCAIAQGLPPRTAVAFAFPPAWKNLSTLWVTCQHSYGCASQSTVLLLVFLVRL